MAEEELKHWLSDSLARLQLDEEAYSEYVFSILSDDSTTPQDKTDSIIDFLGAATEEDLETTFRHQLSDWAVKLDREKAEEELKKKERLKAEQEEKARMLSQLSEEERKRAPQQQKTMSKEEKKQRAALLARFAYDEEGVDENGDIVLKDKGGGTDKPVEGLEKNINAQKVKDEDASKREKAKKEHEKKVQRDKEQREKEILKKEKKKLKTQKQEKRRGAG